MYKDLSTAPARDGQAAKGRAPVLGQQGQHGQRPRRWEPCCPQSRRTDSWPRFNHSYRAQVLAAELLVSAKLEAGAAWQRKGSWGRCA